MKKVILTNSPSKVIIAKLNKTVKNKIEIQDKWGLTDYYFWGEKIVQDVFVWDSARHVNNFFRMKGEVIDRDNEQAEIHLSVIKKPSYYVIYVLSVWFIIIALLSGKFFFSIFAVVFIVYGLGMKQNYFEEVVGDIKYIVGVSEE